MFVCEGNGNSRLRYHECSNQKDTGVNRDEDEQ